MASFGKRRVSRCNGSPSINTTKKKVKTHNQEVCCSDISHQGNASAMDILPEDEPEQEMENYQHENDSEVSSDSGSKCSVGSCSSDTESECDKDLEDTMDDNIEENLFEPLYDYAKITVSDAFCAIMEFKRACRLPFTAIAKLLDLLQLVGPVNNH